MIPDRRFACFAAQGFVSARENRLEATCGYVHADFDDQLGSAFVAQEGHPVAELVDAVALAFIGRVGLDHVHGGVRAWLVIVGGALASGSMALELLIQIGQLRGYERLNLGF
ncbi:MULTISPECIES: hypothetical protein [Mycobacteroides]|uniref:hypothetical protein n=1 Tax=Mycobacteroides TaxID=670516 RepID=UPI001041F824|nr:MULTISPECIES: hypothetical protein [Mycobacteroides]